MCLSRYPWTGSPFLSMAGMIHDRKRGGSSGWAMGLVLSLCHALNEKQEGCSDVPHFDARPLCAENRAPGQKHDRASPGREARQTAPREQNYTCTSCEGPFPSSAAAESSHPSALGRSCRILRGWRRRCGILFGLSRSCRILRGYAGRNRLWLDSCESALFISLAVDSGVHVPTPNSIAA
jgi:hypothetical protein